MYGIPELVACLTTKTEGPMTKCYKSHTCSVEVEEKSIINKTSVITLASHHTVGIIYLLNADRRAFWSDSLLLLDLFWNHFHIFHAIFLNYGYKNLSRDCSLELAESLLIE